MKEKIIEKICGEILNREGTKFVDNNLQSNLAYRPQFLYNDIKNKNKKKKKVLSSLEAELRYCSEFLINVAFIAEGGITLFLEI